MFVVNLTLKDKDIIRYQGFPYENDNYDNYYFETTY